MTERTITLTSEQADTILSALAGERENALRLRTRPTVSKSAMNDYIAEIGQVTDAILDQIETPRITSRAEQQGAHDAALAKARRDERKRLQGVYDEWVAQGYVPADARVRSLLETDY